MKKIISHYLFLFCFSATVFSQFPVGHRQLSWQDPARANRDVDFHIYYPAVTSGDNTAVAAGIFPFIVFGHGFTMGYDAYLFWKDNLVPEGYILVFPVTEGGASPDHADFAADLAFLAARILTEAGNSSSFLYQKVAPEYALGGHSMGGGAAFLACAAGNLPSCMFTFAAAETTPSAIAAAATVTVPSLVMAGADDCVAPPADHQLLMYNALASSCKAYVSINDGVHCYFGDYNFLCTFGESTCNPVPSIQRADQLSASLAFTRLFIDRFLKNNLQSWQAFQDSVDLSSRVTGSISCLQSSAFTPNAGPGLQIIHDPVHEKISVIFDGDFLSAINVTILTITGTVRTKTTFAASETSDHASVSTKGLGSGLYLIRVIGNGIDRSMKFMISR